VNGKQDGLGTYKNQVGIVLAGEWKEGKRIRWI